MQPDIMYTSEKTRMWIGQVFDWCIEQGYAESNPATLINPKKAFGKARVHHFAALEQRDMPEFLARIALEHDLNSVLACRLLALTWTRTKELRMMRWEQIEDEYWRVPADTMKSDEYHLVPLGRQAKAIIKQMYARSRGSNYVFPAEHRLDWPMSENRCVSKLPTWTNSPISLGLLSQPLARLWPATSLGGGPFCGAPSMGALLRVQVPP
ncbi:hypothetical protein CDEF62S_00037 [Castellaniella defragrans]